MPDTCPECGALLPEGGRCRASLHAMLALEWEVSAPASQARLAHFYAVSSYVLQHPDSMRYTVESLTWLRSSVRAALEGEASTQELRERARDHGEHARVTRREGDPIHRWRVHEWTMTVADVLAGGANGYCDRVERWAASVISDLDASDT